MQIVLLDRIEQRLVVALKDADSQEIGGILMGEHISEDTYLVQDLTIQRHTGTLASFVRVVKDILGPLRRFFHRTNHNYTRFNYLGEWHSHPSFALEPSNLDRETMWELVEDPNVGANFAVLLIVRLHDFNRLEGTAAVYLPGHRMIKAELVREEEIV